MEYYEIYKKRLNRYGENPQERTQNKREQEFKLYLNKSAYKVSFSLNHIEYFGSFERYKQDETETLHYLLTERDTHITPGTILLLPDSNLVKQPWMVYYIEHIEASGYNKYVMLRMTHYLTWKDTEGEMQHTWAYLYGQQNNMLKDELKSRSRSSTVYGENLKSNFFITARNQYIKRDTYFVVGEEPFQESYRVTGYDIQSTEGIEYVTIDPIYQYDLTPPPEQTATDPDSEFYWLNGGASNDS